MFYPGLWCLIVTAENWILKEFQETRGFQVIYESQGKESLFSV
jgi:hypothetical protein